LGYGLNMEFVYLGIGSGFYLVFGNLALIGAGWILKTKNKAELRQTNVQ